MRLTCPNCAAMYEVDDHLIPPGGRDVQCSNCGHAWFFIPAEEEAHAPPPPPAAHPAPPAREPPAAPAQPAPAAAPAGGAAGTGPAPARRPLDPGVADILRAEAEREARARRGMPEPLEVQPDLGLPGAPERPARAAAAPAPPGGPGGAAAPAGAEGPPAPAPGAPSPRAGEARGSRRELLPDIEAVTPTLQPSAPRSAAAPASAGATTSAPAAGAAAGPGPTAGQGPAAEGGFRRGFAAAMLIGAVLVLLYLLAPMLAEAVPALAEPLAAYVAAVDALRLWLAGLLQGGAAPAPAG